jgi:signal peptidase I
MQAESQPKSRTKTALRELVETILITLVIYAVIRTFLFENYRVVGQSMDPTLADDQFLVVNKLGYRLYDPQRGDIIVFRDPRDDDRKLIKRIVGLPGETVETGNRGVFIDGELLEEPYLLASANRNDGESVSIPAEHYYVLGDNRGNSSDSRSWGTLPDDEIVGKAWLTYWPPPLWGVIPHQVYSHDSEGP